MTGRPRMQLEWLLAKMLAVGSMRNFWSRQSFDAATAELAEEPIARPRRRSKLTSSFWLAIVPCTFVYSRKGIEKPSDSFIIPETVTKMSTLNISNLARMSRESLAALLASPAASTLAIVDVRDSGTATTPMIKYPSSLKILDHIGGHIKYSIWVPSSELDVKTPELIRTLKHKDKVVFHCALSQQRGPSAALRYTRERHRLLGADESKGQAVYVLDGGFSMWQAKYGDDEKLTEGYVKDIWMD